MTHTIDDLKTNDMVFLSTGKNQKRLNYEPLTFIRFHSDENGRSAIFDDLELYWNNGGWRYGRNSLVAIAVFITQ